MRLGVVIVEPTLKNVIDHELQGDRGDDANDVSSITAKPSLQSILHVHHPQPLPYPVVLHRCPFSLCLEEDLQSLQWTDECPADGPCDSTCEECAPG